MLREKTVFDFMGNVVVTYGISVICICLFTVLFGNDAKEISTIFALGENGIPIPTLIQFLFMALLITALRWLFFTDMLIKNRSIAVRSILMFTCVIFIVGVFAALFHWFPVKMVRPWAMCFISFTICTTVSVIICNLKEKSENKKLQEALERLRKEDL